MNRVAFALNSIQLLPFRPSKKMGFVDAKNSQEILTFAGQLAKNKVMRIVVVIQ